MKFALSFLRAFSLIELLIALSIVSLSFIFFAKVLWQEDSSNSVQSLVIPVCATLQRNCVYHLPSNQSLPLINIQ
ncbi:prepilin-type N-terminal cleavage/methylation domain-containing protein [Helicobacter mesocricetorum]|uniref:prepilin-type N-terminal cleavage/methylation domain-containing protein n=1 Tax=Helicobacter mesocricetorum TaxID=87012 RepID=UPI000CF0264E|nr:prepilin-type N-terminal cleavage/methylation domain-containing protein [Helicobacter mesocricetorum]